DCRATGTTGLCRCALPEHYRAHEHGFRRRDAAHEPGARRMHDRTDCRSFVRRDTHRPPGWGLPAARELHRRRPAIRLSSLRLTARTTASPITGIGTSVENGWRSLADPNYGRRALAAWGEHAAHKAERGIRAIAADIACSDSGNVSLLP